MGMGEVQFEPQTWCTTKNAITSKLSLKPQYLVIIIKTNVTKLHNKVLLKTLKCLTLFAICRLAGDAITPELSLKTQYLAIIIKINVTKLHNKILLKTLKCLTLYAVCHLVNKTISKPSGTQRKKEE